MATLEQAKYNDLIKFAIEQGLDAKSGSTKLEEVRSLIRSAFGDDVDIPVAGKREDSAEPVQAVETQALTSGYRDDPKVIVNIASDDQNGGKRHYPICVNGDQILVKRDTDVAIPYRHYLALRNAKQTEMRQEYDSSRQKFITVESEQYAVRFSVTEMPPQSEIEAFHERTKDLGREPVKKAA